MGIHILTVMHLLAVVIFLGNITVGIFWMHYAAKTKDFKFISQTTKGIIKADRLFTLPSAALLLIAGLGLAMHQKMSIFGTGWILGTLIMFTISGFAFSAKLAPLQRKIYAYTSGEKADWNEFSKMLKRWDFWGLVALISPFLAFLMMILKFPA